MHPSGPGYGTFAPHRADAPIRYDTSTHELTAGLSRRERPWTADEIRAELHRRAEAYVAASELVVPYYRIGHSLAFELPLARRPLDFPVGVLGDRPYPWLIWLGWALEERWRVLAGASREGLIDDAETVLAAEFSALAGWESYDADNGGAGLVTAALASPLANVLERHAAHADTTVQAARAAAERLLAVTVRPWFERAWASSGPFGPAELHNIPCITLFRAAQLATAIDSPDAPALRERAEQVYTAWLAARQLPDPHTEGAAYDGFLLDSMTEWLGAHPEAATLFATGRDTLQPVPAAWADLTLPGRVDLVAPLSDTEAEMPFWAGVTIRLCQAYDLPAERAWIRRFPLERLPGNTLDAALELAQADTELAQPATVSGELPTGRREQPSTLTMRTGWDSGDILVAIGAGHTDMGHLHYDAGHVVLGWRERFWISDPGYQQYVAGPERDYTLGERAHNPPVVNGRAQTQRAARRRMPADEPLRASIDATGCYDGLGPSASAIRDVWLLPDLGAVVVRDELRGLPAGSTVATHWLGGAGLFWGFADGYARLTDGQDALWLVNTDDELGADLLSRHPGSRGSVHLRHVAAVDGAAHVARWVFLTDPGASRLTPTERLAAALGTTSA